MVIIKEESVCAICAKPKDEWTEIVHDKYCPDCYNSVVTGLRELKKSINYGWVEVSEFWDVIHDLFDDAFPRGGLND